MEILTHQPVSHNDNPRNADVDPRYAPGGAVDTDPLPPDVRPSDPRRFVNVSLHVVRVLDGNRSVVVQCEDVYRGSCVLPTGWVKPYQPNREPKYGAVYRFAIPIDRWPEKRRQLLALTIRRAREGVSDGPHDAA